MSHSPAVDGIAPNVDRNAPDSPVAAIGQGGWYPNERVSVAQALRGFTLDAAFAAFSEASVRRHSRCSWREPWAG